MSARPDTISSRPGDLSHSAGPRAVALLAGTLLYAAFWGLGETAPGLDITYHPSFSNSSRGELYFWLGSAFLLFPAVCLLGYGASPWLAPRPRPRVAAARASRRHPAAVKSP